MPLLLDIDHIELKNHSIFIVRSRHCTYTDHECFHKANTYIKCRHGILKALSASVSIIRLQKSTKLQVLLCIYKSISNDEMYFADPQYAYWGSLCWSAFNSLGFHQPRRKSQLGSPHISRVPCTFFSLPLSYPLLCPKALGRVTCSANCCSPIIYASRLAHRSNSAHWKYLPSQECICMGRKVKLCLGRWLKNITMFSGSGV